jgi:hypothetical protein
MLRARWSSESAHVVGRSKDDMRRTSTRQRSGSFGRSWARNRQGSGIQATVFRPAERSRFRGDQFPAFLLAKTPNPGEEITKLKSQLTSLEAEANEPLDIATPANRDFVDERLG